MSPRHCADGHDPVGWYDTTDPAECWMCGGPGHAGNISTLENAARAAARQEATRSPMHRASAGYATV